MLNHVALLKPPLPQLNVELVSWYMYITKGCFGVLYNFELGGGGGDKVFLPMFNNFVILAFSRVLSKIVAQRQSVKSKNLKLQQL
jgi:hypothetical protein